MLLLYSSFKMDKPVCLAVQKAWNSSIHVTFHTSVTRQKESEMVQDVVVLVQTVCHGNDFVISNVIACLL